MQKENRPLQAANIDTRESDVTPLAYTVQASKRIPKKHRARTYMLRCGGWWVDRKRYPAQLPPLIWPQLCERT